MDSFYGGKQGVSFVIKARFSSIDEMIENFSNVDYKAVWYGEYCIIDTNNKNDADNGKVFRRTLNTAGDAYAGLAEYIGQIVGPAGGTPNVELGSIEQTITSYTALASAAGGQTPAENTAIYYNNGSGYISNFSSTPATFTSATASSIQYKSGKDYATASPVVTPAFRYNWYNFREAESDDSGFAPAKIVIGFEIPYVYNEIVNVNELDYFSTPAITVTSPNDFYNQYTLEIPRGIPGAYITNIQQIAVSNIPSGITYYDFPVESTYNEDEKKTHYAASEHNFNNYNGTFWACEFVYPTGDPVSENDQSPEYETLWMYIGTIHEIKDVALESDGDLIITYTDGEVIPLDSKIKWIDGATVSSDGSLIFNYNFDTYYKEIISPTGNPYEQGWYINNGTVTSPSYELVPSSATTVVTGTTYYQQIPDTVIANGDKITWINSVTMQVNPSTVTGFGQFKIDFNNNTIPTQTYNLHLLRDLTLNGTISSDGSDRALTRRIVPIYGENKTGSGIGSEINFIQELITTSDNHLLCLFTASSLRPNETNTGETGTPPQNSQVYTDSNGISWRRRFSDNVYDNITLILDTRCENLNIRNVWYRDLGSLDVYLDKEPIYCSSDFGDNWSTVLSYLQNDPTTFPQVPGTIVYAENTNEAVQKTKIFIYAKNANANPITSNWVEVATVADYATSLQGKWLTSSSATSSVFTEMTIVNENLEAVASYNYTPVWK